MIRQEVQKKSGRLPGGCATRKAAYQEVSVIRHHHPAQNRKKKGHMPEINSYNDFPPSSRYMHLHPVFKLVDSFLTTNGRVDYKKKPDCVHSHNMRNTYATKTSPIAPHYHPQKCMQASERLRANVANINNRTGVRVSLKDTRCTSECDVEKPQNRAPQIAQDHFKTYIENLKAEIKNSREECVDSCERDCDYVDRLKEEIQVSRTRCVEEARNLINELKNEIVNYRLGPKSKYSVSCTDLCKSRKTSSNEVTCQTSKEVTCERCQPPPGVAGCEKQLDILRPLREKSDLEKCNKPFVTLWQSKGSMASSSDMESVPVSCGNNFEEKLEEANCLIDKVRRTLKDIGKGIYQKPQQRRSHDADKPEKDCTNAPECIAKPCMAEAECCAKTPKSPRSPREIQSRETASKTGGTPKASPSKSEDAQPNANLYRQLALDIQTVKEGVQRVEAEAKRRIEEDAKVKKDDKESDIMGILQKKLNAIAELESEESVPKGKSPCGPEKVSCATSCTATQVERACSPIRRNLTAERFSDYIETDTSTKCCGTEPCRKKRQLRKSCPKRDVSTTSTECCSQRASRSLTKSSGNVFRPAASKSAKLTLQVMPPVFIPRALVMQRTLNLCIKPSGSVTNENLTSNSNIGYEEVRAEGEAPPPAEAPPPVGESSSLTCPDECRDTQHNCKYKVLETIIDTQKRRSSLSSEARKHFVESLNDDALLLFKSYQIIDDKRCDESSSAASLMNKTRNIVRQNVTQQSEQSFGPPLVTPRDVLLESGGELPSTTGKTPWEIGFYKTQATQVSSSLCLIRQNEEEDDEEVSTTTSPSVEEEIPVKDVTNVVQSLRKEEAVPKLLLEESPPQSPARTPRSSASSATTSEEKKASSTSSSSSSSSGKLDVKENVPPAPLPAKTSKTSTTSTSTSSSSSTVGSYNVYGSKRSDNVDEVSPSEGPDPDSAKKKSKPSVDQHQTVQNGSKTDQNFQVSLASSTEATSKSSLHSDTDSRSRMNTITCFIKGLTGTSQEELKKIKSNPSFPKTNLQEWSSHILKSGSVSRENDDDGLMSKRSMYEVTLEEVMESQDYEADKEAELAKLAKEPEKDAKKGKKKDKDRVVMAVTEIRRPEGGEGLFSGFTKRKLPFYRRVLGRVVDAKGPMETSHSQPIPLDESISEGEIKCSISTGEVCPCRLANEPQRKTYKKHFEDPTKKIVGDRLRVARQRTHYNNWVTYYLQKHQNISFDDSCSSASLFQDKK